MTIRELTAFDPDTIRALYASVGWTNHTADPEMLRFYADVSPRPPEGPAAPRPLPTPKKAPPFSRRGFSYALLPHSRSMPAARQAA